MLKGLTTVDIDVLKTIVELSETEERVIFPDKMTSLIFRRKITWQKFLVGDEYRSVFYRPSMKNIYYLSFYLGKKFVSLS